METEDVGSRGGRNFGGARKALPTRSMKLLKNVVDKGNPAIDLSESDLIQDIIFVLQGIDGHNITYSRIDDAYVVKATAQLSKPIQNILNKICEMGWLFKKVHAFIENNSNPKSGFILQSLCVALKEELNEYYRLIAIFENLRKDETRQASQSTFLPESNTNNPPVKGKLTLRKLYL